MGTGEIQRYRVPDDKLAVSPGTPIVVEGQDQDRAVEVHVRRVQVQSRPQDRRENHLRRYVFRGMDELRRQQAHSRQAKPPPEIDLAK
jgi:hypothetical protein